MNEYQVQPVFTPEEANIIIELLDKKANETLTETNPDKYRNIIAKIQTTDGYLCHAGLKLREHRIDIVHWRMGRSMQLAMEEEEHRFNMKVQQAMDDNVKPDHMVSR